MAETPTSAPGQPPAPPQNPPAPSSPPVVVKKYANRRLYNTETSSYITLENLAEMIRAGRDFVVYDAKSGDDITRGVLTQIIVEEESKGSAMLPTGFLRQLIGFYGGNLQGVVPRYLEHSMSNFARQQQQVRQMMERTFSPFLPTPIDEMNRQNMALFDRAMSMWNPFAKSTDEEQASGEHTAEHTSAEHEEQTPAPVQVQQQAPDTSSAELERLRQEIESLRHQLAAAHAAAVIPAAPVAAPLNAPANVVRDQAAAKGPKKPIRGKTSVES